MDTAATEQPVVEAVVSADYDSYKAYKKDLGGHWFLRRLIWAIVSFGLALLPAYSIPAYLIQLLCDNLTLCTGFQRIRYGILAR